VELPIRDAEQPDWSPDGKWIVFRKCPVPSTRAGREWTYTGIYKTDVNGTNTVTLYQQNNQIASSPQWSPDGSKIVFCLIKDDTDKDGKITFFDDGDIWVMNSDGSGLKQLTFSAETASITTYDWTPDSLKIVYSAFSCIPGRHEALFSLPVNGVGSPQRIYTEKDVMVNGMLWTPLVGFSIERDNRINGAYKIWALLLIPSANPEEVLWENYHQLWTLDLDGKNPISKMDIELSGSYSPDMVKVVGACGFKIAFADIDGKNLQVTEYDGEYAYWSPTENKIVYQWHNRAGNYLCIMTVEYE
ncbi:MAG: hypothetical protein AAB296_09950, partial [Candidatus Desantisbacteria bacterium]